MKLQTQYINYPIADSLNKLGFKQTSEMTYYGFDLMYRSLAEEKCEIYKRIEKNSLDEYMKPIESYVGTMVPAYSVEELRSYLPTNVILHNEIHTYSEEIRYPFFFLSYKCDSKVLNNKLNICEESYPDALGQLLIQLLLEVKRGKITIDNNIPVSNYHLNQTVL